MNLAKEITEIVASIHDPHIVLPAMLALAALFAVLVLLGYREVVSAPVEESE